ncbi:MAG: ATP-binding cassette domain-containing protein [Caldilineaceae bacterium SB0664_bin_22]|nr:ATP-binding cassette domain-containing protein [Caldilineaceae bacterium SB0664_bin_22]
MTFYAAVTSLSRSFEVIAAVLPGYEQVKPILAALPERHLATADPGELGGDIRFDHVSFRYVKESPLILEDVSFRAGPGEFIAIVGESGSGKSTLMRLALGLEDPVSGSVYYDGRELALLNRHLVRRRIGVVMQDGALQPGSILDNIIGMGNDLTIEDAYQAARLADVDKDIDDMPMGLFTMVNNNSSTFSGGQVQRIRIASALVRNPRIVFLDGATGWLDAACQARVMAGIESLAATRIVIAHRLSTIRRADRIYVLSAGRVVQQGTFEELSSAEGIFHQLAQRQLA